MLGKSPLQNQKNLFKPLLVEFINPDHPLVILSKRIPWKDMEQDFSGYYSHTGTPSKPIRLMVGLLILKQVYNLGDEPLMEEWVRDPYFQFFCGEAEFQWRPPCAPSDLVHFRKRIGKEGVETIFKLSVQMQGNDLRSNDILVDTTAQEKNITYPVDSKQYRKIIEKCNDIAKKEGIVLRQSYKRTVKALLLDLRFARHPRRKRLAVKAQKKLRTIAGRITRDLERKMNNDLQEQYREKLVLFYRVIRQKKQDKNKIYSLHEPDVACIAKGKSHKPYEFGAKASVAFIPGKCIIVGVKNFEGNPNDTQTLEPTLEHVQQSTGKIYKYAIVDRGYPGKNKVGEIQIIRPGSPKAKTEYQKRWMRKKCRSRAAIEPVISHMKYDHRMIRNYLKGEVGDEINLLMAAAAFNFKRLLRKIEHEIIFVLDFWIQTFFIQIKNKLSLKY
jgi:IS5 family transposase